VDAFLQLLTNLDETAYNRLAHGNARDPDPPGTALLAGDLGALRAASCDRCHDSAGGSPASRFVPRLGGQSAEYLEAALRQYRDGVRESGFMETVTVNLVDREIAALAGHYAGLDSPVAVVPDAERLRGTGRQLAVAGNPERDVPACDACHAAGRLAAYPRLASLAAEYQVAQLELWQRGGRAGTAAGRTMSLIAARLSPAEIESVAAYYEALPPARERGASDSAAGGRG